MRAFGHFAIIGALTVLTQIGGLAWLVALGARRRTLTFVAAYLALWVAAPFAAEPLGRVPLPCQIQDGLRVKGIYCALNRHYVTPTLREAALATTRAVEAQFPGTQTLALDAGFPFLDGMPLLPHLSHDDGRKLDFAFYYAGVDGQYLPGQTRSPLGYWAFEDGPTDCPLQTLTMRWDMGLLQPLWPDRPLEPTRTKALIEHLTQDPRIGKILIEPHLQATLGISHPKLRFQGCQAARHDDHIHIQL